MLFLKAPVSIKGALDPLRLTVDGAFGASAALPNLVFIMLTAIIPALFLPVRAPFRFPAKADTIDTFSKFCKTARFAGSVIAGSIVGLAGMRLAGLPYV